MPSFDIVSELNLMEVENAFNQTRKEIAQRFDFKGMATDIERESDGSILVKANADGRLEAAYEILLEKLAKRGVPLEGLDPQAVEPAAGGHVKRLIKLKQGIPQDVAKKIVQLVKETRLKVQASIQGDAVRVSGKKRDDLQVIMQKSREAGLGVPIQFHNFRD